MGYQCPEAEVMATQKKATSPDWIYVRYWNDIIALASSTVGATTNLMNYMLQYAPNSELVYLVDFCQFSQPVFSQPTETDWLTGDATGLLKAGVLAALFYEHAEEV